MIDALRHAVHAAVPGAIRGLHATSRDQLSRQFLSMLEIGVSSQHALNRVRLKSLERLLLCRSVLLGQPVAAFCCKIDLRVYWLATCSFHGSVTQSIASAKSALLCQVADPHLLANVHAAV